MPVVPFIPLIIGAASAGLSALGSTKKGGAPGGAGSTSESQTKQTSQETSRTEGERTGRQSDVFKAVLDQLLASINQGPTVLQAERNRMRNQVNNTYNALGPKLEAGLTSRGFGSSGKLGAGFKGIEMARANQIQSGESDLQTQALQRYMQMLGLALPYTRPDIINTTRSGTVEGTATGSQIGNGTNPLSAAGSGLGDILGLLQIFPNLFGGGGGSSIPAGVGGTLGSILGAGGPFGI
jgi:hypothetical protein